MTKRTARRKRSPARAVGAPAISPATLLDGLERIFAAALDQAVDRLIEALTDDAPIGMAAPAAANYLGIGLTLFLRECTVRPRKIGGRKVWDRERLKDWFRGWTDEAEPAHKGRSVKDPTDAVIEALGRAGATYKKSRKRNKA